MRAYYNEHDPKAAAWLRELIKEGHIAPGIVDERSITEVKPYELTQYTQQHFFAGVGGWSLALRLAGWPDSRPVRTGSCPCQPFSIAGDGRGEADERHLWPNFRDLITFGEPTITFGEQVASALGRDWLAGIRADLEGLGYEVGAADLCAAGVGAPHPRQRLYWMAHPSRHRRERARSSTRENRRAFVSERNTTCERCKGRGWYLQRFSDNHSTRCADCQGFGLVLANGARWHERRQRAAPARYGSAAESAVSNGVGGMGDAGRERDESRRGAGNMGCATGEEQREAQERQRGRNAASGSGVNRSDRLEHSTSPRCERAVEGPEGEARNETRVRLLSEAGGGCWDAFDVLPFRDGKFRRVESGTFPLAHGIPNRVGLLRGYGNAIVPQLAAEFIQACEEAIGLTSTNPRPAT